MCGEGNGRELVLKLSGLAGDQPVTFCTAHRPPLCLAHLFCSLTSWKDQCAGEISPEVPWKVQTTFSY